MVEPPEPPPPEEIEEPVPARAELEIPEEIGEQSVFGDLLGPTEPAEEKAAPAAPVMEMEAPPSLEAWRREEEELSVAAVAAPEIEAEEQPVAPPAPLEPMAPEIPLEAAPGPAATVWTAEPAPVTVDDEKLFAQPPADWEGLTKLVEAEEKKTPFPAPIEEEVGVALVGEAPEEEPAEPVRLPEARLAEEEIVEEAMPEPAPEVSEIEALPSPRLAASMPVAKPAPPSATVDRAAIEQLVRESLEDLMPELVDRVAQSVSASLRKE